MVKKFDVITKLYEEAMQEVTESPEKWLAFLQSASKNYRLPFDEQLLIHVQRPEATAVLPIAQTEALKSGSVNNGLRIMNQILRWQRKIRRQTERYFQKCRSMMWYIQKRKKQVRQS